MKHSLVIVESPAKARTIGRILGKDYEVMASIGHVRDLPKKDFGVDIENDFTPKYVAVNTKKVIPQLKKAASKADIVYLAPDPDREGEAIAWHLKEALKLPEKKIRRVTFHEITPKAIRGAFQNPGVINMNKVNAQQARRILDRLVGYKISPILWKKITKGLSAGRVQSVALRFIVEREKEIEAFVPEEFWRITAKFDTRPPFDALLEHRYLKPLQNCPKCGKPLKSRGGKVKVVACPDCKISYRVLSEDLWAENVHIASEAAAKDILSRLTGTFAVSAFSVAERRSSPVTPFITSLLQQAASNELGYSAAKTMLFAQQLYEGVELDGETVGLITYMRTDSFNVASSAIDEVREFIGKDAGPDYVPAKPNVFASRKGAQEAHEAIRPTSVMRTPDSLKPFLSDEQFKLYDLIWRRFLASQTAQARYHDQKAELRDGEFGFMAHGRITVFSGSERYWPSARSPFLPELKEGTEIKSSKIMPAPFSTQPPPRYSEATLVKTLEKEGIGRPSTYATIISTLSQRGYVEKKDRRFYPTELGRLVADRLIAHFPHIMDVGFTAQMETALDEVEEKNRNWVDLLREFWKDLEPALAKALVEMEKSKGEEHPDAKCPVCGGPMLIMLSRRGKFLGCKNFPKCKGTAPLPGTVEEHPDAKCPVCGGPMLVRLSRRGKFLGCKSFPKCKGTAPLPGTKDAERPRIPAVPIGEKCPKCEKELVRRMSRRGPFIGCSGFPKCRFTRNITEAEKPGSAAEKDASDTGNEDDAPV